ncbi:hypothetical protein quinque_007208 [Culex quinquefasciatus]
MEGLLLKLSETPNKLSVVGDTEWVTVGDWTYVRSDKLELLVLNGNAVESIAVKVETPIKFAQVTENPISALDYGSMVKLDSDIRKQVTNQPPVKPSLWLGETLDTASIADGVDRTTGQLSFTLPIIDLRSKFGVPIRHTFYFNQPEDGTGVDPGVLGKYWSRSMDFIYVDRKDTVFQDEFEYFLVSDGTKVKLEWVRSDGGKEVFKFEDTIMKLLVTSHEQKVRITPMRAVDLNNNFKVNAIVAEKRGIYATSYIFDPKSPIITGHKVAFKKVQIIPNGDFSYGSFEQVTNFFDRSRTVNVLDSMNKTVVEDYKGSPEERDEPGTVNGTFVLYDNFRAIIFDEFRNNPIAVLRHNGRTVQYLYDNYGRKIGEVDERGSVTKLVIYSKQPAQNDVSSIVNLQPVSGFVESMSPYTVGLIWDFKGNWSFSPKRASIGSGSGTMKYKQSLTDCSNIGVRLMINRAQGGTLKIKFSSIDTGIDVSSLMSENYGEITVARYKKFFSVWIDGHLKKEELNQWNQSKELSIEVSGKVDLSDIVVMKDVDLMIEYNNAKGQPVQQITVEDDDHITMRGFVYDAVQRESLRFVVHYKNEKEIDKVFFHKYNPSGEMYEFGVLDSEKNLEQLKTHANDVTYPVPTTNFIRFDYGDTDTYSSYRSRKQSSLKVDTFGSTSETLYFNEDGNVLMRSYVDPVDSTRTMDVAFSYERNNVKEIIYPVNVIADHEGSTRLVVKNGEVVAAYDYLPYGGRMRFYNSDPDGYVAFQYTGQEFDEETGLYNYHARLYDPELGRFYQTDPQEEFPSPYKYAGNSPVMNTDPDGELAFLLVCIVAAVFGAYLAAAAVSNSWNPAKWNWRSGHLWLALFGGALAGAMLPIGGAATFSTFASIGGVVFATAATATIVLAGAYLGMAGAANDFNPANWDFTSPALYSGMLNGASLAVNIPSGVVGVSRTMVTFTTAKTMYGAAIVGGSLLFGYGSAVFANNMTWNPAKWDWNARTVFALFEGGTTILMATSAFVKRGPQKALLPKKPASISTAPTKRWVKKFKHSECRFDAYNDGIGDELGKLRYRQVMTGVKGKMGPVKPPPGMTKEFIAGLPTVKTLGATAVVSAIMLSEDLSKFKVYFTRGKRFADFNPASPSSGTRMFDNIKKFFQFRTDFLTDDKSNKETTSTEVIKHTKRPTPKPIKIHSLTNCIAMNPDRSFYECFQSTAKVLLFAQNLSLESGSIPTGIDRCVPLHWHGQPSVGCQGQQFGFIYTPYEATKMFSFLDGWLMLARVGLQYRRSITGLAKMVFEEKLAALRDDLIEQISYSS